MNHRLLAGHRGIKKPPLISAMHPARHPSARRAHRFHGPGAGLDADRPACQHDPLDRDYGQVREQDRKDIKIARRA